MLPVEGPEAPGRHAKDSSPPPLRGSAWNDNGPATRYPLPVSRGYPVTPDPPDDTFMTLGNE